MHSCFHYLGYSLLLNKLQLLSKLVSGNEFSMLSVAKFLTVTSKKSKVRFCTCNTEFRPHLTLGLLSSRECITTPCFLLQLHLASITWHVYTTHHFLSPKSSLSLSATIKLQRLMSSHGCCHCFQTSLDFWMWVATEMPTDLFFLFYWKWIYIDVDYFEKAF